MENNERKNRKVNQELSHLREIEVNNSLYCFALEERKTF